jgi:linoleoyl-CoA desaturase
MSAGVETTLESEPSSPTAEKLTFPHDQGFYNEVKRRVDDYFARTGFSRRDSPRMVLKTIAILLWVAVSYALLVFAAETWWQATLCSVSLAFAVAGVGFNIQHDGNHGAYSRSALVNRLMGLTLDVLGGSSYVWQWKHNIFHHTYPNVSGADDDLDVGPFARLAPAQPRYGYHRFQQIYLWALYGFLGPKWHFVDDFKNVTRGRIGSSAFPRPRGLRLVELLLGKALFFSWALVLPALFHPLRAVAVFYLLTAFLVGIVLGVVFQLAHCVEEADFPEPVPGDGALESAWAAHQVQTTVDFARGNGFLTWYLGGLNFQIEHHLFPRICHVHYPAIAAIVEPACAEFGVRYVANDTFRGAVRSHWRWLRRMGAEAAAR